MTPLALLGAGMTVGLYFGIKSAAKRLRSPLLSPLLVTPVLLIAFILIANIPYDDYRAGTSWLTDLLQPATVAFAVPLYKAYPVLKKHLRAIAGGVAAGSLISLFSCLLISGMLRLDVRLTDSLLPRSVTTPIAIGLSQANGGIGSVTACAVLATGLLGSMIGPSVIRLLRIRDDVALGVALGTGAHSAGISRALEHGDVAGAVASASMILSALFTLCVYPYLVPVP
ncbi:MULTISPECIES: LrgB family protein [Cohnella]|uniref:LrgB family protein n=1 Tax=Cohnella TaxID=329857 RepID=UPI00111A79B6|nr:MULTISPECIES: LrgB family protein [Cohnella]MBN2980567.1 LrgB family protein [Cohnella algarum]